VTAGHPDSDVLAQAGAITRPLAVWWSQARVARDTLPWRSTRDPWRVLISELMLVQTQASRVAERYPAIVDRFPTPGSLARSPVGDLIALWSGLGYYRRAVSLHASATRIVETHGGTLPTTLPELRALPGLGAYTARAVLAFAFDEPVGPVDTNIRRVLLRAVGASGSSATQLQNEADAIARSVASTGRFGGGGRAWSLALMDLGSTVCVARAPRCGECPIAKVCAWRAGSGSDPVRSQNPARTARYAGSDREIRGTIVRTVCAAPIEVSGLTLHGRALGSSDRVQRIVADLVAEGVIIERDGVLALP
jgi:A/G-specific adenine glycosylase